MNSNIKNLNRICFALMLLLYCNLRAQQINGIFLNGSDFNSNKLSFAKKESKKCKLKLHELPFRSYINVKYCDSSYTLFKDSIFGYQELSGANFRFFNKKIYTVMNQGEEIVLYKIESTSGGTKNPVTTTTYYFSKNSNSPIELLTIKNLEYSFKENSRFGEYIEIHFRNDDDLIEFDFTHMKYKVNRLLDLSKNSKTN